MHQRRQHAFIPVVLGSTINDDHPESIGEAQVESIYPPHTWPGGNWHKVLILGDRIYAVASILSLESVNRISGDCIIVNPDLQPLNIQHTDRGGHYSDNVWPHGNPRDHNRKCDVFTGGECSCEKTRFFD